MKKALWILVFFLLSVPSAMAEDALQQTLQGRYDALKTAMDDRNGPAITALITPDFTAVSVDGKTMSGTQMVKVMASLPKDEDKNVTTVLSATQSGNTATAEQQYVMQGIKKDKDGTPKLVKMTAKSLDTWEKVNNSWLIKKTVTEQMDFYVEGKLVEHKGPANTAPSTPVAPAKQ